MREMENRVKHKTYSYGLLAPYVAHLLDMDKFELNDLIVKYRANKYCDTDDCPDNAMHKMTLECGFGDGRTIVLEPFRMMATCYGYHARLNNKTQGTIGPMEWDVIRPKVFDTFTEYFEEMRVAVEAYEFLHKYKVACGFVLNFYSVTMQKFRNDLYETLPDYDGDSMSKPVAINFTDKSLYGELPIYETVMVSKTYDDRLMLSVASMN
jgi:hypothetical protein